MADSLIKYINRLSINEDLKLKKGKEKKSSAN